MTSIHLVIIDPQNDFMDQPNATLPVAGAMADMKRMSALIRRVAPRRRRQPDVEQSR